MTANEKSSDGPPAHLPAPSPAPASAVSVWDAVLAFFGLAFALPTILYPFGRDQGLYYYVAREWVTRGTIPYKEILDHKPPVIYVIHALSIAVFGEKIWAIRVFEICAVVGFGWIVGAAVAPVGTRIPRGFRGAGAFLLSVLYFGFFDYWGTAQTELWYSGFGISAVWAARRMADTRRAALVVGTFCGLLAMTKPPGLALVLVACALLAVRLRDEKRWRRSEVFRHVAILSAGGAIAPVLLLGYFGVQGALPAMKDIVVGANAYYVQHEGGAPGPAWRHVRDVTRYFAPFTPVALLGVVGGIVRGKLKRDAAMLERSAVALGLLLSVLLAVGVQGKFYLLHWGSLPVALAYAVLVTAENVAPRLTENTRALALAIFVPVAYLSTTWLSGASAIAWSAVEGDYAYLSGRQDIRAFYDRYQNGYIAYYYRDAYDVGTWLEAHSSKDDPICVRGFEPQVYAVANRRHVGRFFWTTFLTNPNRAYRRAEWLAEDARDIAERPPRYIVTLSGIHEGIDSTEYYLPLGYERVAGFHGYDILAKHDAR